MQKILIVVDTLRYDELLSMHQLLSRPHRFFSAHWGVAPFTLPAMASMLSGLMPEEHKLWKDWEHPQACVRDSKVASTIGNDFGTAGAITGGGFALGRRFGYGHGFNSWVDAGSCPKIENLITDHDFLLLHTYEVHDYILGEKSQLDFLKRPWEMWKKRQKLVSSVEGRIRHILAKHPDSEVWVTSDHGEGMTPVWDQGHSHHHIPSTGLLHLPLVCFGPHLNSQELVEQFLPQARLREYIVTGEASDAPVEVIWRWLRDGSKFYRHFELNGYGVRW